MREEKNPAGERVGGKKKGVAVDDEVWRSFWSGLRDEWERRREPALAAVLREQGSLDAAGKMRGEELRVALRRSYRNIVQAWSVQDGSGRQGELGVGRGRYDWA